MNNTMQPIQNVTSRQTTKRCRRIGTPVKGLQQGGPELKTSSDRMSQKYDMDDLNTGPDGSLEREIDDTSEEELSNDDENVVDDDEVDDSDIDVKQLVVRITVSLGLISLVCIALSYAELASW